MASSEPARHYWIDHLRTFVILLVVNLHACITYSHVGRWYKMEGPEPALATKIPFFFWEGHLQAFFMGLMFFLAAHFAWKSLARKGAAAFVRERTVRLLLPTLLYMFVLHPFIIAGLNPFEIPKDRLLSWLGGYYASGRWLGETGPLWFALTLYGFCLLLALWRVLRPGPAVAPSGPRVPSLGLVAATGAVMVIGTFLVRLRFPIGVAILNLQPCFFTQYVVVFLAGLASAHYGWLEAFSQLKTSARIGWAGLLGGPVLLGASLVLLPPVGEPPALVGGWNLPAFLMAFWEQLTGLALGIGCLAWFSRRQNVDTPLRRWLAGNAFGVYVLHAPVIVGLAMVFAPLQAGPWTKSLLLTVAGLAVSFPLSALARRLPGVGRIL